MGYLGWPNKALIKIWILKGQIGLILGRTGWEKERRREEEEEEEEEEGGEIKAKKVWMLGFWYGN